MVARFLREKGVRLARTLGGLTCPGYDEKPTEGSSLNASLCTPPVPSPKLLGESVGRFMGGPSHISKTLPSMATQAHSGTKPLHGKSPRSQGGDLANPSFWWDGVKSRSHRHREPDLKGS